MVPTPATPTVVAVLATIAVLAIAFIAVAARRRRPVNPPQPPPADRPPSEPRVVALTHFHHGEGYVSVSPSAGADLVFWARAAVAGEAIGPGDECAIVATTGALAPAYLVQRKEG